MNKLEEILGTAFLGLAVFLGSPGCDRMPGFEKSPTAQERKERELRETILSYLCQPKFSKNLLEQISGTKAELDLLDLRGKMVYFSVPSQDFREGDLEELTNNPGRVEVTDREGPRYSFRFPINDFRVDETDHIRIPYGKVDYTLSMGELSSFLNNESVYGGPLNAKIEIGSSGRYASLANHGAVVAREGEASLERLLNSLTSTYDSKELKAQKLLDFVNEEIEDDPSTGRLRAELLKRPNEVLMTGEADCSGKVSLYSSLIEQTDIDQILIYYEGGWNRRGHISVAVEGEYPNQNGLSFSFGDKTYTIAEPNCKGFRIGEKKTRGFDLSVDNIDYVQRVGRDSEIIDAKTGEAIPFY